MFPTGAAGVALLLLRLVVAITFLISGTLVTSLWTLSVVIVLEAALCLGFLTPYAAFLCCLMELRLVLMRAGEDESHLFVAILSGAALALIGPGAYSVDSHIFGRRRLSLPPLRKLDRG
jgi:uncharacterized membrane protein YphA (DoxX/SURF4 family)